MSEELIELSDLLFCDDDKSTIILSTFEISLMSCAKVLLIRSHLDK
jgi:hypothetical protein